MLFAEEEIKGNQISLKSALVSIMTILTFKSMEICIYAEFKVKAEKYHSWKNLQPHSSSTQQTVPSAVYLVIFPMI